MRCLWRRPPRVSSVTTWLLTALVTLMLAEPGYIYAQGKPTSTSGDAQIAKAVGTIKSIQADSITVTAESGGAGDIVAKLTGSTKILRVPPGEKDLKNATALQPQDLQIGDRVLVRGKASTDGDKHTIVALSVIVMKQSDVAAKQQHDRDDWQKRGVGGLVTNADTATGTITISSSGMGANRSIAVHIAKDTILRRYAPDSVKFDDAKPAPVDRIKAGDQLRARGGRSSDGTEFAADEIVSGTFRNIAGTISALDASAGTITVQDLASKKSITVKITSESQLRKLPQPMAQRIAARLKGTPPDASAAAPVPGSTTPAANAGSGQAPSTNGPPSGNSAPSGAGGMGRPGGGTGDLQQMISRIPAATLADLQKGDAVMVVATEGGANDVSTVITLLGGVEPILEASPRSNPSTILSPWSLNSGGGGEAATP